MGSLFRPGFFGKIWQTLEKEFCCSDDDFSALIFLSIPFGAFFLISFIVLSLPGGISKQEEFLLYIEGWLFVPVFSIFAVWLVNKIRRVYLPCQPIFVRALLLIDSLILLVLLSTIHVLWSIFKSFYIVSRATAGALILFFIVNLIVILFFVRKRESASFPVLFSQLVEKTYALFPLLMLGVLLNFGGINRYFDNQYATDPLYILIALFGGGLSLLHFRVFQSSPRKIYFSAWDILALVSIVLVCFDPKFSINTRHQNFYLGPVNNLLQGKTVLVDTYSQYGVMSLVFIAKLIQTGLFPLSYRGLNWLVSVLYMIQFMILYGIAKTLVKSVRFAFVILALLLAVNLLATIGVAQAYPSIGPLRFGLSYAVLAITLLRHRSIDTWKKYILLLEWALVGFSSLWSFETFVYTGTMYLGILLYEALFENKEFSRGLRQFFQRALGVLASILFFQALFAMVTFIRAGTFPHWGNYLDLILTYSIYGFGTIPIDAWSPWILLAAAYFVTLMFFILSLAFRKAVQFSIADKLALGITFLGVAQFTYYLGRSHPNNLLHISAPALLIGGYWVARAGSRIDAPPFLAGFQKTGLYSLYAIVILLIATNLPTIQRKYPVSGFYLLRTLVKTVAKGGSISNVFDQTGRYLYDVTPEQQQSADAIEMIRKYWPTQPRVAAFISPDVETEALMRMNKAHLFPLGHPTQDDLSKKISKQILDFSQTLQPGDKILLQVVPDQTLVKLQKDVIQRLCDRFDFKEIERTASGVAVYQLEPYQGTAASYCANLKTVQK